MNFGISKVTSSCCNTDQCNVQDAPDPSNVPNGKTCYSCDGQSCSSTVGCTGTEDRCIKATGNFGGQSLVVKGCASKSFCDATSVSGVESISCCEGNLCNGAQSVTQSFLFLCCSLLSYFLLH
ncbi:urokinase plasminogen activator surface receptor-like [Pseudorasbora parva]|uniref:urokinase plasminogen activator surface receptor-like n=1 Tax=Pseudorasbora parva TaxID=51549 RepID=UPI00351F284F